MKDRAEDINPYKDDKRGKGEQIKDMFDSIAPAYDFMNRAMTVGIDRLWRKKAVQTVELKKPQQILDLATGTGDLAIALATRIPQASIVAADLSPQMLEIGRKKTEEAGLSKHITFVEADGLNLPFDDNSFDCVTIAYGIRNFESLEKGFREMKRVLKPGGLIAVLELSTPSNKVARWLYDIYAKNIIPFVGKRISRDSQAYAYLPESINAVAQREGMIQLMQAAGLINCSFKSLTFGTCTFYIGYKTN
ncbi:MAG: bifunctional demethylmenaquinone methyltransferase/2-methoxy-6-polyprenyl-1,4-benzoquinol methylase UbiE [Muribaculaceae bacterium]|nr:bifunctional demethylmenaquinone methyltransferase/2-methoxy-6-polyprenyl-1,4-benzoquinol methylase UbiE [Muribaculaceae bacterium]